MQRVRCTSASASRIHRSVVCRLTTVSVPRTVVDLDLSNNPLVLPEDDPRASLFARMNADDAYARHISALNLSHTGLQAVPEMVATFRCLTSLRLAHNRIVVDTALSPRF